MFHSPEEDGFREQDLLEFDLKSSLQTVLANTECVGFTDGEVYVLCGEQSLKLHVVGGSVEYAEFGTHSLEDEHETFEGYELQFPDVNAGYRKKDNKRNYKPVTVSYRAGDGIVTEEPYLDEWLVETIQDHIEQGIVITLEPDAKTARKFRKQEEKQYKQQLRQQKELLRLRRQVDYITRWWRIQDRVVQTKTAAKARIIGLHALINTEGFSKPVNRTFETVAEFTPPVFPSHKPPTN